MERVPEVLAISFSEAIAGSRLLVVVGPDAGNSAGGVELHDFGGPAVANVVAVIKDNRLHSPEHIDEFEAKMRVGRESASEVVTQCWLALHDASAVVEQGEGDGRDENCIVVVMI